MVSASVRDGITAPLRALLVVLALLALVAGSSPLLAQALQAQLQRERMSLGESVGLTVRSETGLDLGQLDLSGIEADFEILGRSSGTQIALVNGVTTRTSTLELQLAPRREGRLQIPPLELDGQRSQALSIEVTAMPVSSDVPDAGEDFILQLEVDQERPYVQQQVLLTVRLHYALPVSDGNLSEPVAEGALVTRLGRDESFARNLAGRQYQVLERRYAVIPQQSGQLELGPVLLSGRVGRGGSVFARGQPISLRSRTVSLEVRPSSADFPAPDWLPARAVQLESSLSAGPYRVGEPITRTLRLSAVGVSETVLPAFADSAPANAQIYPDQPSRSLGQDNGRLLAQLEQKLAIVPSAPGTLLLPALRVPWWDVENDRLSHAEWPAQQLDILPALVAGSPAADAAEAISGSAPATTPPLTPGASLWPWLSLLFAVLWLATLALWWLSPRGVQPERRQAAAPGPSASAARRALLAACARHDAAAAEAAVRQLWQARGGAALGSVREIAAAVSVAALGRALVELDQARYGKAADGWNGAELAAAADALQPAQPATIPAEAAALPPLYPRHVR